MIRLVTLVLCFLLAASVTFAEGDTSARAGAGPSGKITLEFQDEPLAQALTRLFQMAGVNFVLDPNIVSPRTGPMAPKVTAKLQNVDFEQALASLLTGMNLVIRKEGDVTIVEYPRDPRTGAIRGVTYGGEVLTTAPATPKTPEGDGTYHQPMPTRFVSQVIPAMPIREAIALVEPGWTFENELGQTLMPGAKFSGIRSDVAAGVMLIAAGLLPPSEGKVVISKGEMSMSDYFAAEQRAPYLPLGTAVTARTSAASAGQWLYTIFAWNSPADRALATLLSTAGVSHVAATPPADRQGLTVRLYDVTLDEALNNIVPTLGLRYRKKGPNDKPTYIIEPNPKEESATLQPRGVSVRLDIAEVVPPSKGKPQESVKNLNSPIFSTLDGQEATIQIGADIPSYDGAPKTLRQSVRVSVLPSITDDGRISLSGSLNYSSDGTTVTDEKISTTVEQGKPQKLPRITLPSEKGKKPRQLEVTVTANVANDPTKKPGF